MALSKLSKDDYITHSFGQKSEAVQGGTYGLVVGGINQTSPTAIGDGEYSPLNVDTSGNLMVNIAAGEVISATINVGTINAATVDLMKAGTITALANGTIGAGTINTMGTLGNVLAGSIAVVAGTVSAGTINTGTVNAGTIDVLKVGTITAGSITVIAGTVSAGTINTGTVNAGTIDVLKVGTITAGSIAVIAGTVNAGTINAGTITAGTINTGTVNAGTIDLLKAGTVTKVEGGTINVVDKWTTYTGTVVIGNTKSAGTLASAIGGKIHGLTQTSGDLDGTGTVTARLLDGAGGTVAELAAQDESKVTYYGTQVPITTNMNWVVTANAAQTADVNDILTIHYEQ